MPAEACDSAISSHLVHKAHAMENVAENMSFESGYLIERIQLSINRISKTTAMLTLSTIHSLIKIF